MEKKELKFTLDEQSIDNLIAELQDFSKRVTTMGAEIEKLSLEELKRLAENNLEETVGLTGYEPTGEMESSFIIEQYGKFVGSVINTHENSAAVEFGTGIIGENTPHPLAGQKGWQYDKNGHGENGWEFNYNGEKFQTFGQVPHRFMYDAIVQFKHSKELKGIVKQAFDKAFDGFGGEK